MRMLMLVQAPHEPFNTLVREGKAGAVLNAIMDEIKPEAVYFSEMKGKRTFVLIVEVAAASRVPALAEPFFLKLQANCEFHIVMSPEDLARSGLDDIGRRWA